MTQNRLPSELSSLIPANNLHKTRMSSHSFHISGNALCIALKRVCLLISVHADY